MVFRKVLYVFLVNLLCCTHAISSEIYSDILSQIPKDVRHNCVYAFVTPSDLASISFVAKRFNEELSAPPFDLTTINQNGLKFALSHFPVEFDQNAEYKQLTTLYRAYLRYKNWKTKGSGGDLPKEFSWRDQNACLRLCALPLNPENNLNDLNRKQIVRLAIDQPNVGQSFYFKVMYSFIIPLLQSSKSLTRLSFDNCQMDEKQWKSAFDAISGQSQITAVIFENYKISESLISYLCNTNKVWRHKVHELNFGKSKSEYRISSTTFLNILTAFSNLQEFNSVASCCLSEQLATNFVFPRLSELTTLKFVFDSVAVDILMDVSNNLHLMPKLGRITINNTVLGDVCVPILIVIKKQRPVLVLSCFYETKISPDAMRQVVKVFADLGYPQSISWAMHNEPDFIGQYNKEYWESKITLRNSHYMVDRLHFEF